MGAQYNSLTKSCRKRHKTAVVALIVLYAEKMPNVGVGG